MYLSYVISTCKVVSRVYTGTRTIPSWLRASSRKTLSKEPTWGKWFTPPFREQNFHTAYRVVENWSCHPRESEPRMGRVSRHLTTSDDKRVSSEPWCTHARACTSGLSDVILLASSLIACHNNNPPSMRSNTSNDNFLLVCRFLCLQLGK